MVSFCAKMANERHKSDDVQKQESRYPLLDILVINILNNIFHLQREIEPSSPEFSVEVVVRRAVDSF